MSRVPAGANPEIRQSLREVWAEIDKLTRQNVDLHGRRLINCGRGLYARDYVTKAQLDEKVDLDEIYKELIRRGIPLEDYEVEFGTGLLVRLDGTGTFVGTRTIGGLWAFEPSGTVPFTTTKSGLVTNLNADKLDGLHGTSFGDKPKWGEIYCQGNVTGLGCATQNSWYQFTHFDTVGQSSGTSPSATEDHISITDAGTYLITVSGSAAGSTGEDFELMVKKNNGASDLANLAATIETIDTTSSIGFSMSGLASLSVSDTVELWVRCTSGASNTIIISDCNLSVIRLD